MMLSSNNLELHFIFIYCKLFAFALPLDSGEADMGIGSCAAGRCDTNPEKWYPLNPDLTVNKFDDLPVEFHTNVNTTEVPYNRHLGDAPALTDAEIDDLIAFLRILSNGYTP